MTSNTTSSKSAKKQRRMTPERAEQTASNSKPDRATSKASMVLDMLREPTGATIEQMAAATGWLSHTTRAALTGFKKKGHVITSDKVDGLRIYRIAPASAESPPTSAGAQHTAGA